MDKETRENLLDAMHGEAFAYVKYMLFAEHARKNGHEGLADLFERTAKVERFEHFKELAELVGLVGTVTENLRDAMEGELYEVETMYPKFAKQASDVGEQVVAERFTEIPEDERGHFEAYQVALEKIEKK
ncbi:MAG: rubrerythrin family protein [Candidatus Bathyarchaeia archaeon]|jgi:rubrerythrin